MEDWSLTFNCNNCVFKTLSCQHLSYDEFEVIRKDSVPLHFKKGETIVKQGGKSTHLVFLHKGIIKFNYETENSKSLILTIVSGPMLLGGANLFFKDRNMFSLVAVDDSDVCLIDNHAFRTVAFEKSGYLLSLFELASQMFQASIFNFISLANKQVNGRVADIIIYLSENVYRSHHFTLTLTRKELAEFAACSQENVITTLSKFNKEGVINLNGKELQITNISRLREISKIG